MLSVGQVHAPWTTVRQSRAGRLPAHNWVWLVSIPVRPAEADVTALWLIPWSMSNTCGKWRPARRNALSRTLLIFAIQALHFNYSFYYSSKSTNCIRLSRYVPISENRRKADAGDLAVAGQVYGEGKPGLYSRGWVIARPLGFRHYNFCSYLQFSNQRTLNIDE